MATMAAARSGDARDASIAINQAADFNWRGRAEISTVTGWRCPRDRSLSGCRSGLAAVVGAMAVHRKGVGVR